MLVILAAMAISLSVASGSALAIGITPGGTTIDFKPGLEKEVPFTIINNEHKDMDVVVYVKEGPYSDWVALYDTIMTFSSDDDSKGSKYSVRLPQSVEKPGTHQVDIVAMELPKEKEGGGAFVGATTAVVTQLLVRVPYPGKYATLDLAVSEAQAGEPVNFFVKARNLGTEDISNAKATLDILGPTNEKIATLESGESGIGAKSMKEFKLTWTGQTNPGVYHAVVTLRYDGKVTTAEKNFAVGNLYIDVLSIDVKDFRLGGVAKFNINIENKWNDKITGVYGNLIIEDDNGQSVADVKTASTDVGALERKEIYAYWDTEGVKVGDYDARFILHYSGRTTEKDLKTHVEVSDIRVDIMGLGAGAVTVETTGAGGTSNMIMLLVVALIGINAGWFFYFRRRSEQR